MSVLIKEYRPRMYKQILYNKKLVSGKDSIASLYWTPNSINCNDRFGIREDFGNKSEVVAQANADGSLVQNVVAEHVGAE